MDSITLHLKGDNILLNYPEKSSILQKLELLNVYGTLTFEQSLMYERLKRGFNGEKQLASRLNSSLLDNYTAIYDLRLKVNESEIQVDCLLLIGQKIFLFEVKNYRGNYLFKNNQWFLASSGKEIKNPLHQVQRSELLLQEFFSEHHLSHPFSSKLIFIHPEFHLYQAPMHTSIIFPAQMEQFIQSLHLESAKPIEESFYTIADTLRKHHQTTSLYEQIPDISFSQLKKGIFCKQCKSVMAPFTHKTFVCRICKQKESKEKAVLRTIYNYQILFPDERITPERIFIWIGKTVSKRTIQRILIKHFSIHKNGPETFYQ